MQERKPDATSGARFLVLALEINELLTEQRILEQEFGVGTHQIQAQADSDGGSRQPCPAQGELLKPSEQLG